MHHPNAARLLIVPGLQGSGPAHWQTWLHGLHRDSLRVPQSDWHQADLARWRETITRTLERAGHGPWIAVGHSVGRMCADQARRWAGRWGSHWINLGDAGHINTEAGFGPLPLARRWVLAVEQRLARERRPAAASIQEWHVAT